MTTTVTTDVLPPRENRPRRPKEGLQLAAPSSAMTSSSGSSPLSPASPCHNFQIPSPIITRRTRTYSASERAAANPIVSGKVRYFCRNKGHGYIKPEHGGEEIFLHVSDIDGEYVPREGDEVTFRLCPVPPKNERFQAVHVQILNMVPGTHERWDSNPLSCYSSSPVSRSPFPLD